MTTPTCPACLSDRPSRHHHRTVRCRRCGHAWFPLELVRVPLDLLYGPDYFQGAEYPDYLSEEAVLKRNFDLYCTRLRGFLRPQAQILEVGCAYGFFMEVARGVYRVEGVDISRSAADFACSRGLDARAGDLRKMRIAPSSFDAACLWDCIEHLDEPASHLAAIHQLLRPRGRLFLTTGDMGALLPRLQGPRWRQYHPPSHLHYFTRSSVRLLLRRLGFRTLGVSTVAQWHSLAYVLEGLTSRCRSGVLARILRLVNRGIPRWLLNRSLPLPTGDIMWVAAEKGER